MSAPPAPSRGYATAHPACGRERPPGGPPASGAPPPRDELPTPRPKCAAADAAAAPPPAPPCDAGEQNNDGSASARAARTAAGARGMSLAEASHERAAAATGLLVARLTRTLTADGGGGGSGGCGVPCAAAVAAPAEEAPQLAAEAPAAAQPPPPPTLRVIGAGLGRTGTLSTKVCHFGDLANRPDLRARWYAYHLDGQPMDWGALASGFAATVDFPLAACWAELLAAHPSAVVLLTLRDSPEAWLASWCALMRFAEMMERRLRGWLPGSRFSEWNRAQTAAFFGVAPALAFRPHEWPPGRAVARYRAHAAAVAACVPPGRLLVFNVKEGWAPLVAFLQRSGVPCTPPPEGTPFPRLNERRSLSYCGIVRTLLASALAERPALGRAALALALAAGMAACARAVAAGGGGV